MATWGIFFTNNDRGEDNGFMDCISPSVIQHGGISLEVEVCSGENTFEECRISHCDVCLPEGFFEILVDQSYMVYLQNRTCTQYETINQFTTVLTSLSLSLIDAGYQLHSYTI